MLLGAAVLVSRYYLLQKNFLSSTVKWFIAFVSLCLIISYAIYCIICLPVLDFRPYKVGTNMREAVTSGQQKFDVKIVYEKDGQTMELGVEEEDPDSTWTYVETRRTPIETQHLATADFYVADADGEDMTEDILLADGYTLLLIIPNLMNADEGCVDKVNEVYDYALAKGWGFYCLTSSEEQQAQTYWNEHAGAEYPYHFAEERMLKTVVRGQPGLVLLQDGVITKKWGNYNLPDAEELDTYTESTN